MEILEPTHRYWGLVSLALQRFIKWYNRLPVDRNFPGFVHVMSMCNLIRVIGILDPGRAFLVKRTV
jgi:hypothetical protein